MNLATAEATANIAVVKYWGKRDERLILPTEGSLSFTMDEQLKTRTTVLFSEKLKEDEFWLNNKKMDLAEKETAFEGLAMKLGAEINRPLSELENRAENILSSLKVRVVLLKIPANILITSSPTAWP